ncbi:hypothetical protein J6590_063534 [Homalodisca vitripennis]|nr:hypothetical protein J6590_063534 [Homalodisca vitripennis]
MSRSSHGTLRFLGPCNWHVSTRKYPHSLPGPMRLNLSPSEYLERSTVLFLHSGISGVPPELEMENVIKSRPLWRPF